MNPIFFIPKDKIAALCRQRGIRRLAVYGSALREKMTPKVLLIY
jgi:predicted nucleotidyltransferase